MASKLIIIAGGIGSGKSVVSRVLQAMGHPVYDCDSRAKWLMNHDKRLIQELVGAFGNNIFDKNRQLDRKHLSAIAFSDPQVLATLNNLVHPAVKRDIAAWAAGIAGTAWIESAIARESGLDTLACEAWLVTAPLEVRTARVMARDNATPAQVEARIKAQECSLPWHCPVREIVNDGHTPLLPCLHTLLHTL